VTHLGHYQQALDQLGVLQKGDQGAHEGGWGEGGGGGEEKQQGLSRGGPGSVQRSKSDLGLREIWLGDDHQHSQMLTDASMSALPCRMTNVSQSATSATTYSGMNLGGLVEGRGHIGGLV
jgi:hypothetical protein